jgi:hypothetical protein
VAARATDELGAGQRNHWLASIVTVRNHGALVNIHVELWASSRAIASAKSGMVRKCPAGGEVPWPGRSMARQRSLRARGKGRLVAHSVSKVNGTVRGPLDWKRGTSSVLPGASVFATGWLSRA